MMVPSARSRLALDHGHGTTHAGRWFGGFQVRRGWGVRAADHPGDHHSTLARPAPDRGEVRPGHRLGRRGLHGSRVAGRVPGTDRGSVEPAARRARRGPPAGHRQKVDLARPLGLPAGGRQKPTCRPEMLSAHRPRSRSTAGTRFTMRSGTGFMASSSCGALASCHDDSSWTETHGPPGAAGHRLSCRWCAAAPGAGARVGLGGDDYRQDGELAPHGFRVGRPGPARHPGADGRSAGSLPGAHRCGRPPAHAHRAGTMDVGLDRPVARGDAALAQDRLPPRAGPAARAAGAAGARGGSGVPGGRHRLRLVMGAAHRNPPGLVRLPDPAAGLHSGWTRSSCAPCPGPRGQ